MRFSRLKVVVLGFLVGVALATAQPAAGASFHQYSVARESSGGSGFTGLSVFRPDQAFTGIPSTGCSAPYTGSPVYQTQWVLLTSDALNWRELGTGHQCNDTYRYWFWGYGAAGAWYPLGSQTSGVGGTHTFKISRAFNGTTNVYIWTIDSTNKASLASSATGAYVEAGLESYESGASGSYYMSALKYQKNGGTFTYWSGRDGQTVGTSMCGRWVTDSQRNVGQNVASC